MTTVHVAVFRAAQDGEVPLLGTIEFSPTARYRLDDGVVLPVSFYVQFLGEPQDVILQPSTNDWVWKVIEKFSGTSDVRYLVVPDSDELVDYDDLQEVDPATLAPAQPPSTWNVALEAVDGRLTGLEADKGSFLPGFRYRGTDGNWEPRPEGFRTVVSIGADPSPDDQEPGDLRMIP
jgi:hypothetical protein